MKTKNTSFDKFSDKELAESFVFPSKRTDEQRQNDSIAIKKLRDESIHKGSDETKMIFQLLQLKYNMEDYIRKATYDEHMSFGSFLKKYVHLANRKQKDFAEEIGMKATELSQIINRHRKPPYGFVIRLEIHSNSAISAICWNRLIEKENEFELMNDKNIWNRERKHVKSRLDIRI
jgi:transcriptional regulator with XRE-family HTH domain